MAVGEFPLPDFLPIEGVTMGVAQAGIKRAGRDDLVLFELSPESTCAGVFTRNRFVAAPVQIAKAHLNSGHARYWLINTGNANAGTGELGMADALRCCRALAEQTEVAADSVLPFSTGVIGEPLPAAKIIAALPEALDNLQADNWARAASGIMTTDTRPKGASVEFELHGKPVRISGISKGAGMIRPNMATMLAFVATDAAIAPDLLQMLVSEAAEHSFNRITVDGDTSTNDACMLVATGAGGVGIKADDVGSLNLFMQHLFALFETLALAIVKDGEGASKFVTVRVEEAAFEEEALDVAYTVAQSPLVKTALFASDPNWGRILAAVGRAAVADLDVSGVSIFLNQLRIVHEGQRCSRYTEAAGQAEMDKNAITILIQLGRGHASEQVWTCDLSHDYVRINAEYRT